MNLTCVFCYSAKLQKLNFHRLEKLCVATTTHNSSKWVQIKNTCLFQTENLQILMFKHTFQFHSQNK